MQGEYTRFYGVKHALNGWAGAAKLGRIFVIVNTTNRVDRGYSGVD
jgi:hypothetical protein